MVAWKSQILDAEDQTNSSRVSRTLLVHHWGGGSGEEKGRKGDKRKGMLWYENIPNK